MACIIINEWFSYINIPNINISNIPNIYIISNISAGIKNISVGIKNISVLKIYLKIIVKLWLMERVVSIK